MLSLLPYFWIQVIISFILPGCTNCFIDSPKTIDSSVTLAYIMLMPDKVRISELNRHSKKYKDSVDFSIKLAGEALAPAKQYHDNLQEAIAFVNRTEDCLYKDVCDKAFLYSSEALEIVNQLPIPSYTALSLNSLRSLYCYVEAPSNALYYHQRVLDILRDYSDKKQLANVLNPFVPACWPGKKFNPVIPCFKESLALGKAIDNKERISESLDNPGLASMQLAHYQDTLLRFNESYEISKSLNEVLRQPKTLDHISRVLICLKRYRESEKHLPAARNLMESANSTAKTEVLLANAFTGANLYEALGNYQLSLKYLRKYQEICKEILLPEKMNELAQVRISYEAKNGIEEESEHLKKEKKLRLLQRNIMLAALALFSLIVCGLFAKQRMNQRKERKRSAEREELMSKALEKEKLEKEVLQSKLEHKSSQMTGFALHISQQNILLRSFLDELAKVQSIAPQEVASKLAKVIQQFAQIQELNKDAENFHLNVEAEYKDFFFNLTRAYPDLTENEKRLCSQIRLNLSIKDIASINNVSVKSVEMARYRLRKRFKMDNNQNLTDWLRQF